MSAPLEPSRRLYLQLQEVANKKRIPRALLEQSTLDADIDMVTQDLILSVSAYMAVDHFSEERVERTVTFTHHWEAYDSWWQHTKAVLGRDVFARAVVVAVVWVVISTALSPLRPALPIWVIAVLSQGAILLGTVAFTLFLHRRPARPTRHFYEEERRVMVRHDRYAALPDAPIYPVDFGKPIIIERWGEAEDHIEATRDWTV